MEVFQRQEYIKLAAIYNSGCRGPDLDDCGMVTFMNVQDAVFWRVFAEYLIRVKNLRIGDVSLACPKLIF